MPMNPWKGWRRTLQLALLTPAGIERKEQKQRMKAHEPIASTIDHTRFGSITINGEEFDHDVLIRLSGKIKKRKKKLSKQVYGTSHKLSRAEAEHIYEAGCETLIIGTGQEGMLVLSDEAAAFFQQQGCRMLLQKTPIAIETFNATSGKKIGVFHVTC
jgi:hypothetical protein